MFAAERHRRIAQMVNGQGSCSISELSREFGVSEMTIHRDLNALENMGLIRKTRGGALSQHPALVPIDYGGRAHSFRQEKDAIGKRAAEFLKDDELVIVEASTTCLSMVKHISNFTNLVVYTNSPMVMLEVSRIPGVEVYCAGGQLSKKTLALVGPLAEESFSRIRADKCFIGANGFTVEDGVTDPLTMEAYVKRRMVAVSNEVYVLVTHDKFGYASSQVSVPLEAIDVVITDDQVDEQFCRMLAAKGVRCIQASNPANERQRTEGAVSAADGVSGARE